MAAAPDQRTMHDAWEETVRPLGPTAEVSEGVFADLVGRYSEPPRHYHTLAHVSALWETLEWLRRQVAVQEVTAVRLALWFHDAVYDPRAADNEERSALLAGAALPRLQAPPETLATVERLILATEAHWAAPGDTDCLALLDCDLAVLGAAEAEYGAYVQAIRREYDWVPEAAFRAGRAKVLDSFLAREFLYGTPPARAALEAAARRNLRRERDGLA